MKDILNPYNKLEKHFCFGCSEKNPHGLRMKFTEDGDKLLASWNPKDHFQGFYQVLHGGIQATLMDEIAAWVIQLKLETAGVTSEMKIQYKKPVYVNRGDIRLEARISHLHKRLASVLVDLFDHESQLCTQAEIVYFTFTQEVAKRRLHYPGIEAFREV